MNFPLRLLSAICDSGYAAIGVAELPDEVVVMQMLLIC